MKLNQWTLGLAALGVISAASVARADEKSSVATALSSTTLSGYVDTSAQWNPGQGDSHAPGYAFGGPGKADGFNLNSVKLSLEKLADPGEAWGAGYKVDLLFGPDAATFNTSSSGFGKINDFAVKQAYVDLKAPIGTGLDIKMGVFDTITSFEVFDTISNPNYTHSWGYTIDPRTHTGVLFGYNITDDIAVQAGIADTYGPIINERVQNTVGGSETEKTYMGSIAWTASTNLGWFSGSSIYACVINGFNNTAPSAGGGTADETSLYGGLTMNTPLKPLKLGASFDYEQNNQHYSALGGHATAVDFYALWQVSEKFSLNGRAEWFEMSRNAAEALDTQSTFPPFGTGQAIASKILSLTATAQYDLWKNVVSRLELRWDHAANGQGAFGGTSGSTINGYNGTAVNSFELIAAIAYKF